MRRSETMTARPPGAEPDRFWWWMLVVLLVLLILIVPLVILLTVASP